MNYLYGDSTPSPLKSNFLEFLRDALDFSVFVLRADERIKEGKERVRVLRSEADAEMARLDAFLRTVAQAIEEAPKGDPESAASRCASRLKTLSDDALRTSLTEVREKLARDVAQLDAEEATERDACSHALATLLVPRDPPDAVSMTRLSLGGAGYEGTLTGKAAFGLAWTFELAIPDGHLFSALSAPAHLDALVPQLEIHAPQLSGWFSKEMKVRPLRIERYVMTEITDDGVTLGLKLRAEPGAEAGFDTEIDLGSGRVEMTRVGSKDEASAASAFDVRPEDASKLVELAEKLRARMSEVTRHRLLTATIGETDFRTQPTFTDVVERLVSMMGPLAREISTHGLTPTELVLRRLLSNDRREEIFVAKATLREKYALLPKPLREMFVPLGLEVGAVQRSEPPPAAKSVPPRSEPPPEAMSADVMSIPPTRSELPPSQPPPPMPSKPVSVPPAVSSPPPAEPEAMARPSGSAPAFPTKNEALVSALKKIVGLAKGGKSDEAYQEYAVLFSSPAFADYRPEDQRQALKLMVLKKNPPLATDAVHDAHRAALACIQKLIDKHGETADYELLGVCYVLLQDPAAASATFAAALALERKRNPQSELCGNLMRRAASL